MSENDSSEETTDGQDVRIAAAILHNSIQQTINTGTDRGADPSDIDGFETVVLLILGLTLTRLEPRLQAIE